MDFSILIVAGVVGLCVVALGYIRRMPNEYLADPEDTEVLITQNLTPYPEKKGYEPEYPLMSSPPLFLLEMNCIEVEPRVENVLLCDEFPMLPIVFNGPWVVPGTRLRVSVLRNAEGEVTRIQRA